MQIHALSQAVFAAQTTAQTSSAPSAPAVPPSPFQASSPAAVVSISQAGLSASQDNHSGAGAPR